MDEKLKKKAKLVKEYFPDIDAACEKLKQLKQQGLNAYIIYNNVKLYSLEDDEVSVYKKITGQTKEEIYENYKEKSAEWIYKKSEELIYAERRIPNWIERGIGLVRSDLQKDWENCVKTTVYNGFCGNDIEYSLRLMNFLKNNNLDETKSLYSRIVRENEEIAINVKAIVFYFSEQGQEFAENIANPSILEFFTQYPNYVKDVSQLNLDDKLIEIINNAKLENNSNNESEPEK